jgi:hypothetical protein
VIDFDENDLHGIPILSQLRPKVTSYIVNYAEDFVTLCHRKTAQAQVQTAKMRTSSKKLVGDTVFVGLQAEDIHRVRDKRFGAALTKESSSIQMSK